MLLSERRYEAAIKQIDERRLQHSEEKGEGGGRHGDEHPKQDQH